MEKDIVVVITCLVISIILFIMYLIAKNKEIGTKPVYAEEVFHLKNTNNGDKKYIGLTPTVQQKREYLNSGGMNYNGGYWLYGAKPKKDSYGISPFNDRYWFETRV